MPANLLDLPRELRDLIYQHALVSPTGYVSPVLCKSLVRPPPRKKPGRAPTPKELTAKPTYRLHLVPCSSAPDVVECACGLSSNHGPAKLPLAYALPQVNQQIREETEHLFHENNTICFPKIRDFSLIMKHMGQTPSRKIKRVQLCIDPERMNEFAFSRAIKKLASRTRLGSLISVEIAAVGFERWFRDGTFREASEDSVKFSSMCHVLTKGRTQNAWARNKVDVSMRIDVGCQWEDLAIPTIMPWQTPECSVAVLHTNWGGKLFWNGKLLWDNGVKVGRVDTKVSA